MKNHLNLLFVCSRNQWRSPTAEALWRKKAGFQARSAGTSPRARKTVGAADIQWADIIFVMEKESKPLHVLDIPDEYKYMDAELIAELEATVSFILESP